jgi:transposase
MQQHHPPVLSVGIDVGKAKLDVACLRSDRTTLHEIFSNTEKGIDALARFLKRQGTAATVPCVLESTGDYHLLAALKLTERGYLVKCINPLITSKYRRASVRDAKSDKIDCTRLAEIGLLEANLPDFADTRESVAAKKLQTVRQKLTAHVQLLKETHAALRIRGSYKEIERAIDCVDRQIETYRLALCKAAPPEAHAIAAMTPGVSQVQVAALLIGLRNRQFAHRDQLVALVGLDVRVRQSGSWQGRQVLSKRGNGYLRKVLFQIGWGLMMCIS